mgnify:CR=1 FL=1
MPAVTGALSAPAVKRGLLLPVASHYDRTPARVQFTIRKHSVAEAAETAGPPDWSACVERVAQDRCRESFLQLFDYYAPRISRYLGQQGMSAEQAEELSQEAMLGLWRKAHLYDRHKAAVSTWLFRIARNLMIDRLRGERGIAYDSEDMAEEPVAEDGSPVACDAATLRAKISELPAVQIELVYKSYFEGKSHGEIAAETGQPLGSVKSRLRAALATLRRQFDVEDL